MPKVRERGGGSSSRNVQQQTIESPESISSTTNMSSSISLPGGKNSSAGTAAANTPITVESSAGEKGTCV